MTKLAVGSRDEELDLGLGVASPDGLLREEGQNGDVTREELFQFSVGEPKPVTAVRARSPFSHLDLAGIVKAYKESEDLPVYDAIDRCKLLDVECCKRFAAFSYSDCHVIRRAADSAWKRNKTALVTEQKAQVKRDELARERTKKAGGW